MNEHPKTVRYILYGAVANRPEKPPLDTKTRIKIIFDRIAFRFGRKSQLNYKNYQQPYTYNRGDHSIIVATAQQLRKIDANFKITTVDWAQLNEATIKKDDKILVCGSGYFFPNPAGIFPQRLQRDLDAIEESGAELHFLGVGYNYLLDWKPAKESNLPRASVELLRKLLLRSITLTVRDENTRRYLSNFTDKEIEVIGDPALFIDTTSYIHLKKDESKNPQIGINIPFHGYEPTEWIKSHLLEFVGFLQKLKNLTDCDFTYFVHYDSEILIAKLIQDQGVSMNLVDTDAASLPSQYSKMDIHIGGMLHSCIIATASDTPCIGLAYDEKHFGFFELMMRPEYCIKANPFNAELLLQTTLKLLGEYKGERFKIKARHQYLASKFQEVIKRITARP